jgi:hypothetical protein
MKSESLFNEYVSDPSTVGEDADLVKKYERFVELRKIPYKQVIAFTNYQNEQTPFSTNHKVKGLFHRAGTNTILIRCLNGAMKLMHLLIKKTFSYKIEIFSTLSAHALETV